MEVTQDSIPFVTKSIQVEVGEAVNMMTAEWQKNSKSKRTSRKKDKRVRIENKRLG